METWISKDLTDDALGERGEKEMLCKQNNQKAK